MVMTMQIFRLLKENPKGLQINEIRKNLSKKTNTFIKTKTIVTGLARLERLGYIRQASGCKFKIN
jgi:DNA-binding PadR family transcriptional regulator